jgi:hypothetical protein
MSATVTQWFHPSVRPVHVGYYETRRPFVGEMVLYWDGYGWRASEHSPSSRFSVMFFVLREWRGLAQKQEASDGGQ